MGKVGRGWAWVVRRRDGGGIVVELWRGGVGTEVGWSGMEWG